VNFFAVYLPTLTEVIFKQELAMSHGELASVGGYLFPFPAYSTYWLDGLWPDAMHWTPDDEVLA
jgi:hypothetical protein